MARHHRLSRRLFLTELGRRSFAVAILGTGVVACSRDGDASSSSSSTAGDTSNPTVGSTTGSTAADVAGDDGAQSGATDEALRWERVDFGFVSAFVLARGTEVAIVDTGTAGNEAQIATALDALSFGWNDVDHVIVTHAHGDHFGGLDAVMTNAPTATGYAGTADLVSLSAPRDLVGLNGGDEVFGLEILATPGHTEGHIAAFDPGTGLLLAGDALTAENGRLTGPVERFSDDIDQANSSVKNLVGTPVDTILVGHGDPITSGAAEQLNELAASL